MDPSSLLRDIRSATRKMTRERAFTSVALLSLALGIGANTALFSVVYGVLMRPLPYRDAGSLIRLSEFHPGAVAGVPGEMLTNFTYHAWKNAKTIEGIAGFSRERFTETSGQEPVKLVGASVTPSTFALLGVVAQAGRLMVEDDAKPEAPLVAVLSD